MLRHSHQKLAIRRVITRIKNSIGVITVSFGIEHHHRRRRLQHQTRLLLIVITPVVSVISIEDIALTSLPIAITAIISSPSPIALPLLAASTYVLESSSSSSVVKIETETYGVVARASDLGPVDRELALIDALRAPLAYMLRDCMGGSSHAP